MQRDGLSMVDLRLALPLRADVGVVHRSVGEIELIVVHYDGVKVTEGYNPRASIRSAHQYHQRKNWNDDRSGPPIWGAGLMYHYVLDRWGQVYKTRGEDEVTWHARGANRASLAVMVQLGEGQVPWPEQLDGLQDLLDWLCLHRPDIKAGGGDVWGHGELGKDGPGVDYGNRTECPGLLRPYVRSYRERGVVYGRVSTGADNRGSSGGGGRPVAD